MLLWQMQGFKNNTWLEKLNYESKSVFNLFAFSLM